MPHRVHTHKDTLRVLRSAKPSLRKAILREADKSLVHSLCEICDNTLRGNVPLSSQQKSRLKRHKLIIRQLADQRVKCWKKKRQALAQHGGTFLPILLIALGSIFGSLIAK